MPETFSKVHSLKFKLMVMLILLLIVVVAFPVGFFIYQLDKNYHDFSINLIETASQVVYQFIYEGMMKNDHTLIQKNLDLLTLDPSLQLVRIYRPDGKVVFSTRPEEINRSIFELSKHFVFVKDSTGTRETFFREGNLYSHHHPIRVQKECLGCHKPEGSLLAVLDVHAGFTQSQFLYSSSKELVIFGGILIILILWIVINFLFQSKVDNKIRYIIRGFEKLADANYDIQLNIPGKDELSLLAGKFNEMVQNLKTARQKEEHFFLEKLERADRLVTLGELAAEIAHDVNNPAGIIQMRAEFLKEELSDLPESSSGADDLDIIIKQTEKIAETTKSILHYARKLPQNFSQTNVNDVIRQSIKVLEPRIKKCEVKTHLVLPDGPALVWGNANQLEQVFCNLINNSLDVVKTGTGSIKIEVNNSNSKIKIIFSDNGPGIPPEFQDQIFSPFFTTKEIDKGTGLGLFIVKNIITNHKGTIQGVHRKSRGAMFVIDLEKYVAKS